MEKYFDNFLNDPNTYDKMRMLLDEGRTKGDNPRIRSLADQTLKQLELYYEICEKLREKNSGKPLDL